MSSSNTNSVEPPDLVKTTDLLAEAGGDISGRTTPSSFRESPIGWGMAQVCGGIGSGDVDARGALINYYQEASILQQQEILATLRADHAGAKFELLAECMFHACAKNFLDNHGKRVRSRSSLFIYDSIEDFNRANTMKQQFKKYKLSSVQSQLAGRASQLVADNILSLCGALGMPYEAMRAFINKPEVVYRSFRSTFGSIVPNVNGTNRGYALWVLYAAARQSYEHATSYVVDDMFYIDVHSHNGYDEDMDKLLNEIGVFGEIDVSIPGYKLSFDGESYRLRPDISYVEHKFSMLINKAGRRGWDDCPEDLNAHLLQLAYVLNPYQEEFSAMLGLLQQTSKFVPNINCNVGSTPISIQALMASHDTMGRGSFYLMSDHFPDFSLKYHITAFVTVMGRAYRHYARHYDEKRWYIDGNMLSNDQKAQMKKELFDIVFDGTSGWGSATNYAEWGVEDDQI